MKEGNMKKFHGQGSIGLIASKISLEGPIIKDKTSFILSARRTYLDILAKPFIAANQKRQASKGSGNANSSNTGGYYFYDFNGKINHNLTLFIHKNGSQTATILQPKSIIDQNQITKRKQISRQEVRDKLKMKNLILIKK